MPNTNLNPGQVTQIQKEVTELLQSYGISQYLLLMTDGSMIIEASQFQEQTLLAGISSGVFAIMEQTCVMLPSPDVSLN